jgi:hypothetical protein
MSGSETAYAVCGTWDPCDATTRSLVSRKVDVFDKGVAYDSQRVFSIHRRLDSCASMVDELREATDAPLCLFLQRSLMRESSVTLSHFE